MKLSESKVLKQIIEDLMKMPVGNKDGEKKEGKLEVSAIAVEKPKAGKLCAECGEADCSCEPEAEGLDAAEEGADSAEKSPADDLELPEDPEERKAKLKELMGF